MGDMMTFPASVEEFMEQYKMTDTEHVYSNGTEYVPIYRMKQWFENCRNQQFPVADVAPVRYGRWVDNHCTACGMTPMGDEMWKNHGFEPPLFERFMDYCPSCGAKMNGGAE